MITFRVIRGSLVDAATKRRVHKGETFTVKTEAAAARLEKAFKGRVERAFTVTPSFVTQPAKLEEPETSEYGYADWTDEALRGELKKRGQTVGGRTKRATMVKRLLDMDAEKDSDDGGDGSGRQADSHDKPF